MELAARVPSIRQLGRHLILRSDDRGRERVRRVFLSGLASLLSRFGTIFVLLVTVPMAMHHLGPDRFGLWMILSSLAAIMAFADFGIGNGVLNMISAASGADDERAARETVSSAAVVLTAIGGVFAVVGVVAAATVDWGAAFHIASALGRREASQSVLVFMLCLAAGVPLSLGVKVQIGLQQGYVANLWIGIGSVLSVITVVLAIRFNAGTPAMVLGLFGSQQAAMLANSVYVFWFQRPDLRPRLADARKARARALLGLGSSFFLLQLVVVIAFRIDAIIIAHFFGAAQAGTYAIYERLFSFVGMIVAIMVMPLWPAYSEAAERGDYRWISTTFRRSVFFALASTLAACLILVLSYRWIFQLWIGHEVVAPLALVLGLAVWKLVEAFGATAAAFLNGVGAIRAQLASALCMVVANVALKLTLAPIFGMAAIVWSTVIAYGCCSTIPLSYLVRKNLSALRERSTASGQ